MRRIQAHDAPAPGERQPVETLRSDSTYQPSLTHRRGVVSSLTALTRQPPTARIDAGRARPDASGRALGDPADGRRALREPGGPPARHGGMARRLLLRSLLLAPAVAMAGCGPAALQGPTAPPVASADPATGSPHESPAAVAHPTGASDVVLRFDEGGGLLPVESALAHVPTFTLYGDGAAVFAMDGPPPGTRPGEPVLGPRIRVAHLGEAAVQDLLALALGEGGLGGARERYDAPGIADAPTAVFRVRAGGIAKTVSVVALDLQTAPGPDTDIRARLALLGGRLRDFSQLDGIASAPFVPTAYRGVLVERPDAEGLGIGRWPWPDLTPADFAVPDDPALARLPTRVLTPAQAAALGVEGYEGGVAGGLALRSGGRVYAFVLRPLLPDEAAEAATTR